METDFVKAMEIKTQTTTIDGIMNTLVKDTREGEKGNYTFGYVPSTSTKTHIHNKIAKLFGVNWRWSRKDKCFYYKHDKEENK